APAHFQDQPEDGASGRVELLGGDRRRRRRSERARDNKIAVRRPDRPDRRRAKRALRRAVLAIQRPPGDPALPPCLRPPDPHPDRPRRRHHHGPAGPHHKISPPAPPRHPPPRAPPPPPPPA